MNRRHFLQAATASALALAIDPERLLWEPGKRLCFDLWTPPRFSVGDFVVFKTANIWARSANTLGGEWVLVRTGDIERCPNTVRGRSLGVVSNIGRENATIQISGMYLTPYPNKPIGVIG